MESRIELQKVDDYRRVAQGRGRRREGSDDCRVVEPLVLLYKLYRVVKVVEIDASFVA